ncbi:MAG: hypothetical protein JKY08_10310 [Flavobacteriaceae bacterium]|nr:hypothetical protein [Flavobacteriaceae bacterium]
MNTLIAFFLRYLLAPIIIMIGMLVMSKLSKAKGILKMKKLIIFVLIISIILALPSLLGMLRYEFIWGGLVLTILCYLLIAGLFNWFSTSKMYKTIGLGENKWHMVLSLFIAVILASWIYYLVFSWLSKLNYSIWAMFNVLWFFVPIFYVFSKNVFVQIPTPFYKLWSIDLDENNDEYWNNVDTFRLMQVTVKIKRSLVSTHYSSFSVKLPEGISLGLWFNRFVEDQNIRFPNEIIEFEGGDDAFGWIFYTNKWLPFPLFTRMLNFDEDVKKNKLKNKTTVYVRRVSKKEENKIKK